MVNHWPIPWSWPTPGAVIARYRSARRPVLTADSRSTTSRRARGIPVRQSGLHEPAQPAVDAFGQGGPRHADAASEPLGFGHRRRERPADRPVYRLRRQGPVLPADGPGSPAPAPVPGWAIRGELHLALPTRPHPVHRGRGLPAGRLARVPVQREDPDLRLQAEARDACRPARRSRESSGSPTARPPRRGGRPGNEDGGPLHPGWTVRRAQEAPNGDRRRRWDVPFPAADRAGRRYGNRRSRHRRGDRSATGRIACARPDAPPLGPR